MLSQLLVVMVNHFLILSRKPIETTLGSSCLKSGTGKQVYFWSWWYQISAHILVYTIILHFMHLLATFWYLPNFLIFPDRGLAYLVLLPERGKKKGKQMCCGRPIGYDYGHPLERKQFFNLEWPRAFDSSYLRRHIPFIILNKCVQAIKSSVSFNSAYIYSNVNAYQKEK